MNIKKSRTFLVFLLAFAIFLIPFISPSECSPNMVGYWTFDNNSDDYFGNNNLIASGTPTLETGVVNGAYEFYGEEDWFESENYVGITGYGSRTMMAWVYPRSYPFIILNWGYDNPNELSEIGVHDYKATMFHKSYGAVFSDGNISLDTWTHITVTTDEYGNVSFYINGDYDSTKNVGTLETADTTLWIGYEYWGGAPHPADGLMDEIAIFNRTLTAGEVQQMYDSSFSGNHYCGEEEIIPPNATNFPVSYGSTNFSAVPDLNNVTNLTLATANGKIQFPDNYSINASGENYDGNVIIGYNFVSVNTNNLNSNFNASANITLNAAGCANKIYTSSGFYSSSKDIIDNGVECTDCQIISCSSNSITFQVSHFSSYAVVTDAAAEISSGLELFNQLLPILIVGFFAIIVIGLLLGAKEFSQNGSSYIFDKFLEPEVIITTLIGFIVAGLMIVVGIIIISQLGAI